MIQLQPVDSARHRSLIARWLTSDHVARWWGKPSVRLAQFDATPNANHMIINRDAQPIGYIRWETVDLDALASIGLTGIPEGAIDMDIFIGDPVNAGRGAGPAALQLVFDHLFEATDTPLIGLCTSVENTIAHSAFGKAGCARIAHFSSDTFGPCWVYACQSHRNGERAEIVGSRT